MYASLITFLQDGFVLVCLGLLSSLILFSRTKSRIYRKLHMSRLQRRPSVDITNHKFLGRFSNSYEGSKAISFLSRHSKLFTYSTLLKFKELHPVFARSFDKLRNLLVRDFVSWWYEEMISTNQEFVNEVQEGLEFALLTFCMQCVSVDWRSFVMNESILLISDLLRYVRITEEALSREDPSYWTLHDQKQLERLENEVISNFNLHPGVKNKELFLRKLSSTLLKQILRSVDYQSSIVKLLVREILSFNVLEPLMGFITPYWINIGISTFVTWWEQRILDTTRNDSDSDEEYEDELSVSVSNKLDDEITNNNTVTSNTEEYKYNLESSSLMLKKKKGRFGKCRVKIGKWAYRYEKIKPYVAFRLDVRQGRWKWSIWKKYSHFVEIHQEILKISPQFQGKLPKKKFPLFRDVFDKSDDDFIDKRMVSLNDYVQKVLFDTRLTQSAQWRQFLIPDEEDVEGIHKVTTNYSIPSKPEVSFNDLMKGLNLEKHINEDHSNLTKPLYELIGEIFELEKRGWLRRQVGWMATQIFQNFDSKLNRMYINKFEEYATEGNISSAIQVVIDLIWPDGKLVSKGLTPTPIEEYEVYATALEDIMKIIPGVLRTFLGGDFVELRMKKLFRFFQLKSVIQHLAYTLLERIVIKLVYVSRNKTFKK